jgi:hypothetical protein
MEMLPKLEELRRDEPIDFGVLSSGSASATSAKKFVVGKLGSWNSESQRRQHWASRTTWASMHNAKGQIKQDGLGAILRGKRKSTQAMD